MRRAVASIVLSGMAALGLALAAASSLAASSSPRSRPAILPSHPPLDSRSTLFFQGFESGVPPTGWARSATASIPFTWHASIDSTVAHEGLASAAVEYSASVPQNELLTSPSIDLTTAPAPELRLAFWWFGDPFYSEYADFVVSGSTTGAVWTELWRMSNVTGSGSAWRLASIDIGAYAGGPFRVRLSYVGQNGGDLLVDEVAVLSEETPLPPTNDDCAGALTSSSFLSKGIFSVDADNSLAVCNYPLALSGSCTGFSHTGRDLVWIVDLAEDESLVATMTTAGHWDDSLFLLTDCASPQSSCVAGDNALPDGSTLSYTRQETGIGRYYLVASGYANGAGPFHLEGTVGAGSTVESVSWGRVKAAYR